MNKRKQQFFISILFVFLCVAAKADGDHHADTSNFKTHKLTDNIYMLQSDVGGNIAVLTGEDGFVMVDSEYKKMTSALEATLQQFGGKKSLRYIINTHWHGDHTEGNLVLGGGADIVAHENVRSRLLTGDEPYPDSALPDITFEKKMDLYHNDEHIQLRYYAFGHTDSDSVVFFKSANVVHMGDLYFSKFYPFIDASNGANVLALADAVEKVIPMINVDTKVIPGHGPIGSYEDFAEFRNMLVGTIAEVKAMKAEGMTLEEMQAKGISSKWDSWELPEWNLTSANWIKVIDESL